MGRSRAHDRRYRAVVSADRYAVWAALAWPYLDTEPSYRDRREVVHALDASRLSISELKRIDRVEVGPALWAQALYGRWLPVTPSAADPSIAAIERRLSQSRTRRAITGVLTAPIRHWQTRSWWRWLETELGDVERER